MVNERILIISPHHRCIASQPRSVDAKRNRKRRPDMRESPREQYEGFLRTSRGTQRNSADYHSVETGRVRQHVLRYDQCAEAVPIDENRKSGISSFDLLEISHDVAA